MKLWKFFMIFFLKLLIFFSSGMEVIVDKVTILHHDYFKILWVIVSSIEDKN